MTPDEFVRMEQDDVNAWWRLSSGEQQNLFEAAMEERDRLKGVLLSSAKFSCEDDTRKNPCWCSVRAWLYDLPHEDRCQQIRTALYLEGNDA